MTLREWRWNGRRDRPVAGLLGAVVVTHTNPGLALACARSLGAGIDRNRLVVVVNAPDRVDRRELDELRGLATVVSPPLPCGYGENANLGVATLPRGVDHVLIANDDVVFAAGALATLSSALGARDDTAIVGPLITDGAGVPAPTCCAFPSVRSELADHLVLPARLARLFPRFAVAATPGIRRVDWVLGAALMVRRPAFEAVGGLDPRYVLYSEEIDLCRRLADRGWWTVACGDTAAAHLGGASTGGSGIWEIGAESRNLYITRHWRGWQRACLVGLRWPVDAWNLLYTLVGLARDPSHPRAKLGRVMSAHRYMRVSWRWRHERSGGRGSTSAQRSAPPTAI